MIEAASDVRLVPRTVSVVAIFLVFSFFLGGCSADQRDRGVVRGTESTPGGIPVRVDIGQPDSPENGSMQQDLGETSTAVTLVHDNLTEEEVVTLFTVCLRDLGFSVPDPTLNADETVNWTLLKSHIDQDSELGSKSRESREAMDACLPLLDARTFAKQKVVGDEIEKQDTLLEFAQCLRDKGINVPDPGFSGSQNEAMDVVKEAVQGKGSGSKDVIGFEQCRKLIYGSYNSANGKE